MSDPSYNLNTDGSFMNKDEIFRDLITYRLPSEIVVFLKHDFQPPLAVEEADMIRKTNFNPYAYARVELGRWIRNSYGLWDEANPYTNINPKPNESGILDDPIHPDNLSGDIIDDLVRHYQKETVTDARHHMAIDASTKN